MVWLSICYKAVTIVYNFYTSIVARTTAYYNKGERRDDLHEILIWRWKI